MVFGFWGWRCGVRTKAVRGESQSVEGGFVRNDVESVLYISRTAGQECGGVERIERLYGALWLWTRKTAHPRTTRNKIERESLEVGKPWYLIVTWRFPRLFAGAPCHAGHLAETFEPWLHRRLHPPAVLMVYRLLREKGLRPGVRYPLARTKAREIS